MVEVTDTLPVVMPVDDIAGVREYWVADPATRAIEVMTLNQGAYKVVGIYQNQALLPSKVVLDLPVRVAQFFA